MFLMGLPSSDRWFHPTKLDQGKQGFSVRLLMRRVAEPMKKSRCTDQQIAFVLQQAEAGTPVPRVCRKTGVYEPIFYQWKQKYGGLMPSEVKNIGVPGLRNRLDLHRRPHQP